MKIPFDATVLRAVAAELQPFVGGKVQRIVQPDEFTVTLELYAGGAVGVSCLLLSCQAEMFRAHLVTRRHRNAEPAPAFCTILRTNLEGKRLESAEQVGGDRVLVLRFAGGSMLVAELMGKHSNIVCVDPDGRIAGAAKWVGRSKSVRPIQVGRAFSMPPVMGRDLGLSPFAQRLVAAGGSVEGPFQPVLSEGNGAYPYSVAALGVPETAKGSISLALELHFDAAVPKAHTIALQAQLAGELKRVLSARDAAVADLEKAVAAGMNASDLQRRAELILAFGPAAPPGASVIEATDFDGLPTQIRVDPELSYKENAEKAFKRARKAKDRLEFATSQLSKLTSERDELAKSLSAVESAESMSELEAVKALADRRHWLHSRHVAVKREERPFEGHRVRELFGPGECRVLYGETAEANDYLTLRVAKPNDYWLHVRGGTSAHVVVVTNNHPDRVGLEVLLFAASIAVKHSQSKHSGIVAVDYTLKKHVRKPKGAAKGAALYTHEKTLHVQK